MRKKVAIMKTFLKVMLLLMLIGISIGLLLIGKGYDMYKEAIQETPLEEKVEEIKSKANYTKISELPQMYLDAVISVEDHRFYKHSGIDVIAIGRAIINDIKAMDFVEGGSTITQQIAKNEYFTQEKKITRKIAEVFMAYEIEKNYLKDEILELYINTIYFGNGYYNIKDACEGYFGKSPNEMTEGECIMLAGIPNAPSVYNPKENPKLAKERQKQVADKMVEYGYLSKEKEDEILEEGF
jgi:monofunctional glycosyltransferase